MKYPLIISICSIALSGCATKYDYKPTSMTNGITKEMALGHCNIEAENAWAEHKRAALEEARLKEQQAIANAPKSYDTHCSRIGNSLNCTTSESPFSGTATTGFARGNTFGTGAGLALSHGSYVRSRVNNCMQAKGFIVIKTKSDSFIEF